MFKIEDMRTVSQLSLPVEYLGRVKAVIQKATRYVEDGQNIKPVVMLFTNKGNGGVLGLEKVRKGSMQDAKEELAKLARNTAKMMEAEFAIYVGHVEAEGVDIVAAMKRHGVSHRDIIKPEETLEAVQLALQYKQRFWIGLGLIVDKTLESFRFREFASGEVEGRFSDLLGVMPEGPWDHTSKTDKGEFWRKPQGRSDEVH